MLPSLNSTESWGIVQVESMSCGTPVVATDLPGVRMPVKMTGMGRIVPPRTPRPWRRRSLRSWTTRSNTAGSAGDCAPILAGGRSRV